MIALGISNEIDEGRLRQIVSLQEDFIKVDSFALLERKLDALLDQVIELNVCYY